MNMIGQPIIALIEKKSAEHLFDDQQPTLNMLKEKGYNFSFKDSNISGRKSPKKLSSAPHPVESHTSAASPLVQVSLKLPK